jgi:hypothetical protein
MSAAVQQKAPAERKDDMVDEAEKIVSAPPSKRRAAQQSTAATNNSERHSSRINGLKHMLGWLRCLYLLSAGGQHFVR